MNFISSQGAEKNGFIHYWKFKLVPETGDIFPFYRFVGKKTPPLIPYKNWRR
jgi:hypothetical protein